MLPGNGGIPFRTTDLGFCSDSSEVIFTIPLLAPVSHHHRLALPSAEKLLSSSMHFRYTAIIYLIFLRCQARC